MPMSKEKLHWIKITGKENFQDYYNRGETRTQSEINSVEANGWGVF